MQAILRKRIGNSKGVTLVELLAVLVILGIIALIAVPAIAGVIEDSKESSIKSTAINMINAAELYAVTNDVTEVTYDNIKNDYVKERDGITWKTTPKFDLSGDEIKFSGKATIDDDVTVNFNDATVNDINESEGGDVGTSAGGEA
ncbi:MULTISPECIES: type II secretion system protein [Allobacillus]|uniref:Prepilin-type N-terminal cleavage/methylation domain-containing protein n=1 Tax=Allobacillus salarius TaxID=1955272 RepID=A0A556PP68_9BACI|nr:prepilin-type N-terminal cleavage/methylation domain-containing protein [Allobacillus salarius]TSJ66187.1 prepilin-type N-terminal cleavage/methylation domain-containing protein [Allobacillus salarius]